MIKARGIGGVFFKVKNPEEHAKWYKDNLGFELDAPFCASFKPKSMPKDGSTVWGTFKEDTDYFEPSKMPYMINIIVDDVAGALKQVEKGGAKIVGEVTKEDFGTFGWFIDPAGIKVELWTPPKT